jgi:16S rRNA (cytosine967-C5)-methyltransferase
VSNIRALAAQCLFQVVDKGQSLSQLLPQYQQRANEKDRGLLQALCYGVLRYLPELEFSINQLMASPLKGKQRPVHFLLLVGLYQQKYTRIPDYAAVGETVNGCQQLKFGNLKKLVNGVLRNAQRYCVKLPDDVPDAVKYNHPSWFIKQLKQHYPQQWQSILHYNQQKPPMWLRVNQMKITLDDYLKLLNNEDIQYQQVHDNGAILLADACDVNNLPGFTEGLISVQDAAAQYAALLLECETQQNILDCCAAPGGKTCHILESVNNNAKVLAIDIDSNRLHRVQENLARLQLSAEVLTADAAHPETWWNQQPFDRILLDAPCSATGVIRRHPDIKWLRKADDILQLAQLQQQILHKLWPLLAPNGILLYATCSVLPEENSKQIQQFLANTPDAELVKMEQQTSSDTIGWQLLPDENNHDGFYYAKLRKIANA